MTRWLLLLTLLGEPVLAKAPDASKRPLLRPADAASPPTVDDDAPRAGQGSQQAQVLTSPPRVSLRPQLRRGAPRRSAPPQDLAQDGALCGDPALQGERVGAMSGHLPGCGIVDAVRLTAVSGVLLSQRSTMDCRTAQALRYWLDRSVKPAFADTGGGIKGVRVIGHYVCRTRNHKKGAPLSEHGRGRAIDIAAFILQDGTRVTVREGWTSREHGQALRQVHRDACGPFGTVLGPNADSYHQDHFHFDTARHRRGTYCR